MTSEKTITSPLDAMHPSERDQLVALAVELLSGQADELTAEEWSTIDPDVKSAAKDEAGKLIEVAVWGTLPAQRGRGRGRGRG